MGDARGLVWTGAPASPSTGTGNAEPALAFPLETIGEFPGDILDGRTLIPADVVCVATFREAGFWATIGDDVGPGPLGLPPMAS